MTSKYFRTSKLSLSPEIVTTTSWKMEISRTPNIAFRQIIFPAITVSSNHLLSSNVEEMSWTKHAGLIARSIYHSYVSDLRNIARRRYPRSWIRVCLITQAMEARRMDIRDRSNEKVRWRWANNDECFVTITFPRGRRIGE